MGPFAASLTRKKIDGEILAGIGVGYLIVMMGVFSWFAYRTGKTTAQDLMERRQKRRRR